LSGTVGAVLMVIMIGAPPLAVGGGQPIASLASRDLPKAALGSGFTPAALSDRDVEVFIQLDIPSVSEYNLNNGRHVGSLLSKKQQRGQAARIDQQQEQMRNAMAPFGATELGSLRVGANGSRWKVKSSDLASIRLLPGVKSVARVTSHTPDLVGSVPWINADVVQNDGNDGSGVSVGIIDTGIDYTHANFGGSGDPNDYATNDPDIIEPGTFPTARVVGGHDFVGTDYNADDPANDTPMPDPDPLDEAFHGSHVAGIAGGSGVPGNIGVGVAPGVDLYALKVFGANGSTNVTSEAIEWALDPNGDGDMSDHLDVINMSLGSQFGSPNDPSALASTNAAALGIIVVASAGNENPVPYVTGSPGTAPGAISVAASLTGGLLASTVEVTAPSGVAGFYENVEAAFTPLLEDVGPVFGPLVNAEPANGCSALTNPGAIAGNVALIERGACTFQLKFDNAEAAGAIAVLVSNNVPGLIVMGGGSATIPGTMILQSDGALLAGTDGVAVTLDAAPAPQLDDNIADFSSSGPGQDGSRFKPDIAAPGVSIVSALFGTGTDSTTASGTSMAAPHVAGVAALVHNVHPTLEPGAVKGLLQSSSVRANTDGVAGTDPYPTTRQGVGVVRADRAVDATAYAVPAGIGFGRINPTQNAQENRNLSVFNMTGSTRHFTVTQETGQTFPGVTFTCPSSVSVPPNGRRTINVQMSMDPSIGPFDNNFFSQTEADGWCVLEDGTDTVRIGYMAVVDPASRFKIKKVSGQTSARNIGPNVGFVEGMTLAGLGGQILDGQPNAIDATGYRKNSFFGPDDVVEFGIVSEVPWDSMSAYEIDILLDTDQDGTPDFVLVAADLGFLQGLDATGQMVTALLNLNTGEFLLEWFVGGDQNDRVAVLTVDREGPFGFLNGGDTTFDYTVLFFDLRDDSVDVQVGSIDLNDEVIPAFEGTPLKSFGLGPGDSVRLDNMGAPGDMLWMGPNDNVNNQATVISGF